MDESKGRNIRKFVLVKLLYKNMKLQLDSGSDLNIININTWKKNRKTNVNGYPKIARCVIGKKIKFERKFITNMSFNKKTLKLIQFITKNKNNLFGTDWMKQFKLWNCPIMSFCQEIKCFTNEAESLKKELKIKFSEVFSGAKKSKLNSS